MVGRGGDCMVVVAVPESTAIHELTHGMRNREGDVVAKVQSHRALRWRK
jgi:hypothetical protein